MGVCDDSRLYERFKKGGEMYTHMAWFPVEYY